MDGIQLGQGPRGKVRIQSPFEHHPVGDGFQNRTGVLGGGIRHAPANMPGAARAVNGSARHWMLRWETLPRNRDEPRAVAPQPTELRLYDVPDADTGTATRVGS